MKLNIQNDYDFSFENLSIFEEIMNKTVKKLNITKNYVLSCIFCDDAQIHKINLEYRQMDRPTDVISFALLDDTDSMPIMEDEIELGDIFINIDACKRQAKEYDHSFERELSFLFTHGLLHLLGYDHMEKEEEIIMIQLQKEILNEIVSR